MKKSLLYHSFSILLCISILLSFTGCSSGDFTLYFGVDSLPRSLDPQRATLYSEKLAVRNCFAGLTKLDENDNPVLDVAETYSVSGDGLRYTFTIGNSEWNNGERVTANDFVFALKRACDPGTKAQNIDLLLNISGAKELLSGQISELGVTAENEDTVTFELLSQDSNFLYKLSSPVFMPCNEEFFNNSKGKYGLGVDYILTNGKFKVASWSTKGNFVRLNRVGKGSKSLSEPKSVYISMGTSGKDSITRINDAEVGMTLNHTNDFSSVDTSKYTVQTNYNKNYIIVFNKDSTIGKNTLLTEAFSMSIDRENFSSTLSERYKSSLTLLPEDCIINGKVFDQYNMFATHKFSFSKDDARAKFLAGLKNANIKNFPQINAITVDDAEVKKALTSVIANWQSNLGAYINIETVQSEEKLMESIKNNNFTLALIPVSGNIIETLNLFKSGSVADIKNEEFDKLINEISSTYNNDLQNDRLFKALEILSKESSVIPIFSAPNAAVWNSEYQNVHFSKIDMTVDFSNIQKN